MQQKKRVLSPIPPRASYRPAATADVYSPGERAQFAMPQQIVYVDHPRRLAKPHHILAGMIAMALYILFGSVIALPWWGSVQDQWNYGSAHVAHVKTDLGDAYSYQVQIVLVVEVWMKGKEQVFTTTLPGSHAVITLQAFDANGDGKQDIIASIQGNNASFVLFGTGTGYQTVVPNR